MIHEPLDPLQRFETGLLGELHCALQLDGRAVMTPPARASVVRTPGTKKWCDVDSRIEPGRSTCEKIDSRGEPIASREEQVESSVRSGSFRCEGAYSPAERASRTEELADS